VGKDLEGSSHGIYKGTISVFACIDSGKPQKTSVRIANILIQILIGYLPNTG
jgi:hypothetical protein